MSILLEALRTRSPLPYPLRSDTAPRATWPAGLTHLGERGAVDSESEPDSDSDYGYGAAESPDSDDVAMANMDQFADWLGGHCYQQYSVTAPVIRGTRSHREHSVEQATVPELATLMLSACPEVRAQASDVLRQRYLAELAA